MNKIAIIIPTIERDYLVCKVIQSIFASGLENYVIYVLDQNREETYSTAKRLLYIDTRVEVVPVPYNAGISYCRNKGVELAREAGIPFCLIAADSITFDKNMAQLNELTEWLKEAPEGRPGMRFYDLIGLNIAKRIPWEAKLNLIPETAFELDFIDKSAAPQLYINENKRGVVTSTLPIYDCDIVRNFFMARTEALFAVQWDNELLMAEHEDFFWRFKQAGYKVGWTSYFEGLYCGCKEGRYGTIRTKNWQECVKKVKAKYNIRSMWRYVHQERIQVDEK